METRPILVLLGLLATGAVVADTWTWTDDEGVVHYSDRPHPGAERIAIAEPNTSQSPARGRRSSNATSQDDDAADEGDAVRYNSLEIAAPGAEETLWNIEGTLSVSLSLSPALQPGHQVRVYFDGNPQIVSGTSFQLQNVYRGVHNLQAEVLDETGTMMIRSRTNRFYVQQSTVR
ncbi:MAG: DUF4124 domain-containing protein [Gammaproteobacteria bacterium]|nr:DUF4124 domain-containing protein [Gammaproteobacteria bacterium]MDH5618473.1 DUF4124 domain-containing protein [Gammaproteobacteria bacterium]